MPRLHFGGSKRLSVSNPLFVLVDTEGNLVHSEMTYGNSVVMVGNEWSEHRLRLPPALEAASENSQIGKNEAIKEEFYGFAWSMD